MRKRDIIAGAVCMLLAGTSAIGFWGWHTTEEQVGRLKAEMAELQRKEKRSVALQSVSRQLEEIAYEQKQISDEQREEALQQTRIANQLREQSEIERHNAITAQKVAMASELKALEAYDMAEHQRIQAEFSKLVADTLSFLALGRSLGSLSITENRSGNEEIANMLSYAAYLFTSRYNGDIYYPAIYQSLSLASGNTRNWMVHEGAVMQVFSIPGSSNRLWSCSNFGEILQREIKGDDQRETVIFKDSRYDFRDIYGHAKFDNVIYVVSHTGHLLVKSPKEETIIPLPMLTRPFKIEYLRDNRYFIIVGEDGMAEFDMQTNKITARQKFGFKAVLCSRFDYHPAVFDANGAMYIIESIDKVRKRKTPVQGAVTAFASSKNEKMEAYGMSDGTIFLVDSMGKTRRLVGHRSRISKLKINGKRIFSSSFDGTLNLWVANNQKIEPMTMLNAGNWIMNFTFDPSKQHIWAGCQKGNIVETLISLETIVKDVRRKLKRDFTREEWNYYIGENVPYESLINTKM